MERRQRHEHVSDVFGCRDVQRRRECMEVGVFWIQVELDPDPDSNPALDLGSVLASGSTYGSRSRVWSRDLDLDLDPVKDPATGSGFGSHIWIKIGIPMRILLQAPDLDVDLALALDPDPGLDLGRALGPHPRRQIMWHVVNI